MTEPITVVIPGRPVGKERPRYTGNRVYTPKKTSNYELLVRVIAIQEMRGKKKLTGPVEVNLRAHYGVPASWPRAKRNQAIAGGIQCTSGADTDNITKQILDSLQSIVFDNDRQVVRINAEKAFTPGEPFVVATVRPVASTAFAQLMENAGAG